MIYTGESQQKHNINAAAMQESQALKDVGSQGLLLMRLKF